MFLSPVSVASECYRNQIYLPEERSPDLLVVSEAGFMRPFLSRILGCHLPEVSLKLHICRLKLFGLTVLKRSANNRLHGIYYQRFGLLVIAQPLESEAWLY